MTENPTPADPEFDELGHPLNDDGEPIHRDVDPIIPTGICRDCP